MKKLVFGLILVLQFVFLLAHSRANGFEDVLGKMDAWTNAHQSFVLKMNMKQPGMEVHTDVYKPKESVNGIKSVSIVNSNSPAHYSFEVRLLSDGSSVAYFPSLKKSAIIQQNGQVKSVLDKLKFDGSDDSASIKNMKLISKESGIKPGVDSDTVYFNLDTEELMNSGVLPPFTHQIRIELVAGKDGKLISSRQIIENQPPIETTFEFSEITEAMIKEHFEGAKLNAGEKNVTFDEALRQVIEKDSKK